MAGMNKTDLSETDIISIFILPAIKDVGWDVMTQIRQEVKLRDGKVVVRGKLAARLTVKSADIVLYHKPGLPLAVVEAKANKHEIGKGMQQGLDYARLLDVPFVFASNGDGLFFTTKPIPHNSNQKYLLPISRHHNSFGINIASGKDLPLSSCRSLVRIITMTVPVNHRVIISFRPSTKRLPPSLPDKSGYCW